MANILTKQTCAVSTSGEIVVVMLGNVRFNLEHETAVAIATDLRMIAKEVKAARADIQRGWNCQGILHDANARPPVTNIDGRVEKLKNYEVSSDGQVVILRIGGIAINISYQDALTIAGWLRIRGKEAARNAGDNRHWAKIASADNAIDKAQEVMG